jgi:hypothetical protein
VLRGVIEKIRETLIVDLLFELFIETVEKLGANALRMHRGVTLDGLHSVILRGPLPVASDNPSGVRKDS